MAFGNDEVVDAEVIDDDPRDVLAGVITEMLDGFVRPLLRFPRQVQAYEEDRVAATQGVMQALDAYVDDRVRRILSES